jgi:hypothetical protein
MRASEFVTEHQMVWTRRKVTARSAKPVMKWRCTAGPRKGRVVPKVTDCGDQPNVKARERMKTTRARTKVRQARRAKRTKRINPVSRLIQRLNKYR